MSVGDQLGLDDNSELLDQARQKWPAWVATDPRLGVVDNFDDLRSWLPTVDHEESDQVLLALAMLAAPDGGDDLPAVVAGERRDAVRTAALADALPAGVGRGELLHPQALRALVVGAALSASEALALPVLVANLEDFPRAA